MNKNILIPKKEISDFCRVHHIKKFALFGSVLRDDFGPESDIDILVEFESGHTPGFAFFELQDSLSSMLGRKVDLNTVDFLSPYFRDAVIKEAQVEYVQS